MKEFEGRRVIAVVTKHINKGVAQLSSLFFDDGTLIGADGLGCKLAWRFADDSSNAALGSIHVCKLKLVPQKDGSPLFIPEGHGTETLGTTDWSRLEEDDAGLDAAADQILTFTVPVGGKLATYRFQNRNSPKPVAVGEDKSVAPEPIPDSSHVEITAALEQLEQRLIEQGAAFHNVAECWEAQQTRTQQLLEALPQDISSADRQNDARYQALTERITELTTRLTTTQQEVAALQTAQQQSSESTRQQLQTFEQAVHQLREAFQAPQEPFDPQSVWSLVSPAFDSQQAALAGIRETLAQPPSFLSDLAELKQQVAQLSERMPDPNLSTVMATTVEDRLRPQLLDTSERLSLIRDQLAGFESARAEPRAQQSHVAEPGGNGHGEPPLKSRNDSVAAAANDEPECSPAAASEILSYESENAFLEQLAERVNTWCGQVRAQTALRFHATMLTCRCLVVPHVGWGLAYAEAVGQPLHIAHVEPEWLRFETAFDGPLKAAWQQAIADSDRIVLVLLDGVNRSPTAAWLQPWLNLLRGGPVQSNLNHWPENLRMLITFADEPGQFDRQKCLQPAMASVLSDNTPDRDAQSAADVQTLFEASSLQPSRPTEKTVTAHDWLQWQNGRADFTDSGKSATEFDLSAVSPDWRSSVMRDLVQLKAELQRLAGVDEAENAEGEEPDFGNVARKLRVGLTSELFSEKTIESPA
ncbi:MAG: hypothetical protein R3C49_00265 [Planctomycetaceae bacterium]